jgi:hypothetical protein
LAAECSRPAVGEHGEGAIDVAVRHCIQVDASAAENGIISLDAWEPGDWLRR